MNFSWLNQIIKRKGPFILCLCFVSGLQLAICSRHFLLTNRSFYRLFRNSYPRCMIKHGLTSNLTCVSKHLKLFEIAALRKLSKMHGRQGKMDGSWICFVFSTWSYFLLIPGVWLRVLRMYLNGRISYKTNQISWKSHFLLIFAYYNDA